MPRIKRSASVIDSEPSAKKIAVPSPKRKGVIRPSACAGCLILLASWLPEDGEPPWCYDFEAGSLNGVTMRRGTAVRTCIRCSAHGARCYSEEFLDEKALDLHHALEKYPRDNANVKFGQKIIRNSLVIHSETYMPDDAKATQFEEVKFREYSESLGQAIEGFEVLIENVLKDAGMGDDAAFKQKCKDGMGLVKFMFEKVRHYSPKRFASGTMEGMGFI